MKLLGKSKYLHYQGREDMVDPSNICAGIARLTDSRQIWEESDEKRLICLGSEEAS